MAVFAKWWLLLLCAICLAVQVEETRASADVMQKLTIGFSKVLEQCKKELNVPDQVMQDFFNFWREEYDLVDREMGCVMICMASKFDLITEEGKLHHINAHEFAKSHGADDSMAKQLVTMIHECEKTHAPIRDDCERVLQMSKCFKTKIHDLKWAPSMEVVLEEVMTELKPQK